MYLLYVKDSASSKMDILSRFRVVGNNKKINTNK
jgi:hypothetical protein